MTFEKFYVLVALIKELIIALRKLKNSLNIRKASSEYVLLCSTWWPETVLLKRRFAGEICRYVWPCALLNVCSATANVRTYFIVVSISTGSHALAYNNGASRKLRAQNCFFLINEGSKCYILTTKADNKKVSLHISYNTC